MALNLHLCLWEMGNVQISFQKICRQDMSGLNFAKFKIYWHLTVCNTVDWISLRNEMFYHTREVLNQARARYYGECVSSAQCHFA